MSFTSKFLFVVFMVLLYLLVVLQQSCEHGCSYPKTASLENRSRKVVFKSGVHGARSSGNVKKMVGWGLREAPLGPDPLHHNGASPKKPKTP